jgi:hypothetical protein
MAFLVALMPASSEPLQTRNVFLIVSDGLRWQEVFDGAQQELLNSEHGGVANPDALRTRFWRDTPETRRTTLLPFFWSEIERNGQLLGNRTKSSAFGITNDRKFSYPGYNEILTGRADPGIDSNDKRPNPNATVFEWLERRPGLKGQVALFATWDVFPYIFNVERSGLPIWPTWDTAGGRTAIQPPELLTEVLRDTTPAFDSVIHDSFLIHAVADHVRRKRPRLMFIGFGETDEWAHAGRYDRYLNAAHQVDDYVRRLWELVQSIGQFRGKTTFILTTDHGRGTGLKDWRDHGEKTPRSEESWIAVIGPDTPAMGERSGGTPQTSSQIAATIASLLGEDYQTAYPESGPPILDVLPTQKPER